MKTEDKRKLGKKSRAAGKRFELKVREDLEKKDWIVFRNSNDISIIQTDIGEFRGFFKQAKSKWNPFKKCPMMTQSGFPDFICMRKYILYPEKIGPSKYLFEVKFVECKIRKYLDKIEKQKVEWIKENLKIPVIVAFKGKKRGEINYEEV